MQKVYATRNLPSTILITSQPCGSGATYFARTLSRNQETTLWKKILETPSALPSGVNMDGSVEYLPTEIQVENTSRCNLRCRMCPQSLGHTTEEDLGLINFAKILDKIGPHPSIIIQGTGEPLMDRHFFAMARMAHDMDFSRVQTTSNGLLLTPKMCDKLYASGLNELTISMDSPEKTTYEAIRVGGNWDHLQRNLEYLCAHPHRPDLVINLSVLLHPETVSLLPRLVPLAQKLGVSKLTVSFDLVFWGEDDLEEGIMRERQALLQNFGSYRALLQEAEDLQSELYILMPVPGIAIPRGLCPYATSYLGIRSDGLVTPCCRSRNIPQFFMGNIFKESLEAIWNGNAMRAFRRAWLKGTPPPQCRRSCFPES